MSYADLLKRRQTVLAPTYQHFYKQPLHLVKGKGLDLWDVDGKQYLDCYNNVVSVGHCHPRVVEALTRQANTLNTHTRYLHENIVELAETLATKLPGDINVSMFSCTGTEANDLAIQIARQVTGNYGVIVCEAGYHGNSTLVKTLSTDSYPAENRPEWLAVIETPNLYRGPYTYADSNAGAGYLEMALAQIDSMEKRGFKPAALLIDTVWDSNGPLNAPDHYVLELCEAVRQRGGLIISDEVQSGYCRTGQNFWGCQNYQLQPDMITCGKPMGGGHPIALTATTSEIAQQYSAQFSYFNTFGGNPVSTAVGKAVLDVIEDEQLLDNAKSTGAYLKQGLDQLVEKYDCIGDVQGSGLFWGLDMVSDSDTRQAFNDKEMRELTSLIVDEGVITGTSGRHGQILKLRPPLPIQPHHIDVAITAIDNALRKFTTSR